MEATMAAPGDAHGSTTSPGHSNHVRIEEKHDTSTHHTSTSTMSPSSSSSSGTAAEHRSLEMYLPPPRQVSPDPGEPKDTRSILRALHPEFLPDCKMVISRTQYYSRTRCSSPHLSNLWKTTFAGDDEYQPDERLKVLRRYIAARIDREEQLEGTGETSFVLSHAAAETRQDEWRALRERGLAEMNAASSSAIDDDDDDDDDDESTSSDETFDEERDHLSTAFRRLGVQSPPGTDGTGSGPFATVEENAEEVEDGESEPQSTALNWKEFPRRPKEKYVCYAQEKGELQRARETNSQPLPEGFAVAAAPVPPSVRCPAPTPEQTPRPSPSVPREPCPSSRGNGTNQEGLDPSHHLEDRQSPTSTPVSILPRLNASAPASGFPSYIGGSFGSGIPTPKQANSLPCPRRRTAASTAAQGFCRQSLRHSLLSPPPENAAVSAGATGGVVTNAEANGELSRTTGPTLQALFPTGAEWHNVEYYLPPGPRRRGAPSISLLTETGEVVWAEDRILSIGEARLTLGGGPSDEEEMSMSSSSNSGKSVKWGDVTVHRLRA